MRNACRCLVGLVLAAVSWPGAARAHGGADASAFLIDPAQPGVVVDEAYRFTWFDASDIDAATASTTHTFNFSSYLPPPWPVFAAPDGLEGTPIVEDVPELDPANAYTWDTSEVPAGVYFLWSIAADPDLQIPSQTVVFSPFPLVVAHAGDPVAPWATLETPDSPAAYAEGDRYELAYSVFDPDGTGSLTLERGDEDSSGRLPETFVPVDVTLAPSTGSITLDTSDWPEGRHVLRIAIEDARGMRFSSFARFSLLVARTARDAGVMDGGRDAGSVDGGDAGAPDAGSSSPPESKDGCICAGRPSASGPWVLLAGLAWLRRRRDSERAAGGFR